MSNIGVLPEKWKFSKLKFALNQIKDGTHGTFARTMEGRPFLSAKNVYSNEIVISENESMISEEDYKEITKNGFPKRGDLLLTIVGTIGRVNLYELDEPLAFQRSVAFLRLSKNYNPRYYFYYLQSDHYLEELMTYAKTSAQSGVYMGDVSNTHIVIPPLELQGIIADYLDDKVSKINDLIKDKEQLIQLLNEKRQSMITEAVTKGLNPNVKMKDSGVEWIGEIPCNYKVIKLKHLVETKITDGPHETPVLHESGVPFISAEAIKSGSVDFNYMRGYISEEDHKKFSRKCLPRYGDIFMVKSGATTGKIGIVDNHEEFSIWSPLALIRANKGKVLNNFLYYYMQSDIFQKQVQLGWNYGTQQNIGMGVIENLFIICPPMDIQKEILNEIDIEFKNCDRLNEELNMQIQKLKEYRQSLIYEAVTGKIDVRDFEVKA
ncbi:TPA: restriction endonuclease subunit S [Bacillus cereus]|nr:restriction endonuclease subunit S [Bacillus cereus]